MGVDTEGKLWIGKDYTNWYLKDVVDVEHPYIGKSIRFLTTVILYVGPLRLRFSRPMSGTSRTMARPVFSCVWSRG